MTTSKLVLNVGGGFRRVEIEDPSGSHYVTLQNPYSVTTISRPLIATYK